MSNKMKRACEIFEAYGDCGVDYDLNYIMKKYEELIAKDNTKEEIDEIECSYEYLLNKICSRERVEKVTSSNSIPEQHFSNNTTTARDKGLRLFVFFMCIMIIFIIFNDKAKDQVKDVINKINLPFTNSSYNRTPSDAVHSMFRSIDSNDIEGYIESIDYKGMYEYLEKACLNRGVTLEQFKKAGEIFTGEVDNEIEKTLGEDWSETLEYIDPVNTNSKSIVYVSVIMNGETESIATIKVPGKGWFVYEEFSREENSYKEIEAIFDIAQYADDIEPTETPKDDISIYHLDYDLDLLYYMGQNREYIIDEFGNNYEEDYFNGGKFIRYENTPAFFFDAEDNVHIMYVEGSLSINNKNIKSKMTFEKISKILGIQGDVGKNQEDDEYYFSFDIANYHFTFHSYNKSGSDWWVSIEKE